MKVEFHVHTRYSKDSTLGLLFVLLMCKIKKIDCIAITDHNEIMGAKKYKEKLKRHNIDVIVGEEIFTSDGEIIGLFLNEKILPGLSPKETIKEIKRQGGIIYVPHPYDEKRKKSVLKEEYINKFAKYIDLIEVHNGRNLEKEYDIKQKEISEKINILPIIGSDAHIFWELGRNYVIIDSIERENIIEAIKRAKFKEARCIKISHKVTKYIKAIKMIFKGDINGLFRIINKKCRRKM